MMLTNKQLKFIGSVFEKDLTEWDLFDIVTAWRCLEYSEKKGQLSTSGWGKKYKDMQKAFKRLNLPTMMFYEKELKCLTRHFIQERIDTAPEPSKKKGANIPPYSVWKKVILATKSEIERKTGTKKLRAASGLVLLVWTLSTGARLKELLRLRKSDLDFDARNGLSYIKITIRRSKRSRDGRKPIYYYAHEDKRIPEFCPVKAFAEYCETLVEGCRIFEKRSDLVFPKSNKVLVNGEILAPKDSHIHTTGSIVVYYWHKTCRRIRIPFKFWIEAHSGRCQVVNAAWAENQTDEQIMDITNWSNIKVLPEYISGPKPSAITVKLTKMSLQERDATCVHITN